MEQSIKKFLEFNGKQLYFAYINNQWWIAVKPICEALGVDYIQQFKNIKTDKILSGVLCKHTMHDASNRRQKMVCLPERNLYGWLFKINSPNNQQLDEYQWKCYDVLYDFFHGYMAQRSALLNKQAELRIQMADARLRLKQTYEYKAIAELAKKNTDAAKFLKELDEMIVSQQLSLFEKN